MLHKICTILQSEQTLLEIWRRIAHRLFLAEEVSFSGQLEGEGMWLRGRCRGGYQS